MQVEVDMKFMQTHFKQFGGHQQKGIKLFWTI